ncbi:MAG: MBL fold metallo-hydrolase [Phycisphaerae bacterium]
MPQRIFPTLLAAIALAGSAYAQRDFSDVTIKATKVAGSVYMLEGSGGNIGVCAGPDGILVVDDQFAPLADKILAAIKEIDPGPIKFILNTHWHGDHTGGNVVFGPLAPIIAQTNVRQRLTTPQHLNERTIDPLPAKGLPVITFDNSITLHFNGEEIDVIHFPHGHTDGDSVVFFKKSNVVHMGDLMFSGMFPFVDLDHGGDIVGLAVNVAAIIERLPADVKLIPGHGPISTLDDLKAFHAMLEKTTNFVRKRIKAGRTLDALKEAGLPEKWKPWGTGFIKTDRWIETIYKSLTRE